MSNRNTEPTPYDILITEDGSPTIVLPNSEAMHSPGGAVEETLYIYKPAVDAALKCSHPHIVSVGLGLGYNEFLCYANALQNSNAPLIVHSFENQENLRTSFLQWLQGDTSTTEMSSLRDEACKRVAQVFELSPSDLKQRLWVAVQNQELILHRELKTPFENLPRFHGILYDAYCARTSPDLWTTDFLANFVNAFAAENCAFATYAATGNLSRILKNNGFYLDPKRPGFGKKRNSTFAIKGEV